MIMTKKSNADTGHERKSHTFSFNAPGAMSVQLVGDFTQWQEHPINLRKEGGGIWRARVELKPGDYHYRFLVDGEWRDDPECRLHVANPYGSENSVLQQA